MRLNLHILQEIEQELKIDEKVFILFLMLDDFHCFVKLLNLFTDECTNIISEFIDEIGEWNEKFIEALCIVKNYRVLENLGESVENLQLKYLSRETRISYKVNPAAKILHRLFDSFDAHETKIFLDSIYKDIPRDERLNSINILELHALYWIHVGYISLSPSHEDLKILLKHLKQIGQYDTPIYIDIESFVENYDKKIKLCDEKLQRITRVDDDGENSQNSTNRSSADKISIQKGICLILNEMHFPHTEFESRESSKVDALNLEKTFRGMNFEVKCCDDIDAHEIIKTLDELTAINVGNYDCFVVCILSHGYPGGFIAVDGTEVSIDTIEQKMCSSAFRKAVKILIVQACQGQNTGLATDPFNLATDGVNTESSQRQLTNIDNYKLFFSFMSTMKHYISIRHRSEGSWFIEDVCHVLRSRKSSGKNISIDQWSKEVKKKVQSRRGYIGRGGLAAQLPETRDRLSKEVFFPLYSGN